MILLENDAFPFRANRHELSHLDPFQDCAVGLRASPVCVEERGDCSPAVEIERKHEGQQKDFLYL